MARVYHNALYPNGEGDIHRDQLLRDHIKKLAQVVTPNHKDLRIPRIYHYECPWPWAQAELAAISAYKTPRDKLQCVFRCATTIMNLLSMASERGIPAADDLIPVLVYVIIKVIPCSLVILVSFFSRVTFFFFDFFFFRQIRHPYCPLFNMWIVFTEIDLRVRNSIGGPSSVLRLNSSKRWINSLKI